MNELRLDKNITKNEFNKTPMYLQIREVIFNKIMKGEYVEGDRLPSENELTEMFNVSRMTVSKALEELVNQDLLVKLQGKGTFVKGISKESIKISTPSLSFYGFSDSTVRRGLELTNIVYDRDLITPSKEVMDELGIKLTQDVFFLKRLRCIEEEPVALQLTYINSKYCDGIEMIDFTDESLYGVLKGKFGLDFVKMQDRIEAVAADAEIAELLDVEKGFPILLLKRITFIEDNIPVEFAYSYYRSDKHVLSIESGKRE